MSLSPARIAEITAQKQRMTFAFGDVKSALLKSFRSNQFAYLYEETVDGNFFVPFDTKEEPVWDDIMAGSFKVGDHLSCQLREGKEDVFFQLKYKKSITNIYDPERYIKGATSEGKPQFHYFVKPTGITVLAVSQEDLGFDRAFKLLKKEAKAIINYDQNDYAVIKKTAAKKRAPEADAWGFDFS